MVCINESLNSLSKMWYRSEQYESISWIVQVYTTNEIQRMTYKGNKVSINISMTLKHAFKVEEKFGTGAIEIVIHYWRPYLSWNI